MLRGDRSICRIPLAINLRRFLGPQLLTELSISGIVVPEIPRVSGGPKARLKGF